MQRPPCFRAALVTALLACVAPLALAHQHAETGAANPDPHATHATASGHDATPLAAPATPYASDAPMREAMAAIAGARDAWHADDPATATALAATIDQSIATMIANCRLAPDADAALHGIIGRLARDAGALRRQAAHADTIASIDSALGDYARFFQPPGFTR